MGDEYLVGYGMDWQGLYRNLRSIWAVLDMEAFVNDPAVLARSLRHDHLKGKTCPVITSVGNAG